MQAPVTKPKGAQTELTDYIKSRLSRGVVFTLPVVFLADGGAAPDDGVMTLQTYTQLLGA